MRKPLLRRALTIAGTIACTAAFAQSSGGPYVMTPQRIGAGGAALLAPYGIRGSIAQPLTTASSNGPYVLTSGIWRQAATPGGTLFSNGFE